ncbi:MAG: polysaccharide biosynthesis/export family protein [Phycisphaerales bacterium]|nr:MAG: polysaccharide biosynthesis/export family protein [Phycisphaerales bacterium]
MNARTVLVILPGKRGNVLAAVSILGLLCAGFCGCAPDHRMSFATFLQESASPPPAVETGAGLEPSDINLLLGPYKVGPSDVLSVTLNRSNQEEILPILSTRVDRDGAIDLPMVGAVSVANMELEDIEDAIRSAYVPSVYNDLVVHAELLSVDPTNVLVVGAVTEPGLVPLRRTERNLLFAIVQAGGVSADASGYATVKRLRSPGESEIFNLRDPVQLQQALSAGPLASGDIVEVHAAQPNTVFVGGLVYRPGAQNYPPGIEITILQALAAAGGVRTDVFPTEGTLVRRASDGEDKHVRLDLTRLATGEDRNIALMPGDILWIPETWETRVQSFINQNLFFRAGVSVNYNVSGIEYMNRHGQQSRRTGGAGLQDAYDPFGFLGQNTALQGIQANTAP